MSLSGIKLVTFDVTNTLLKFRVPPWTHYAIVARDHGFQGNSNDIKERLLSSYKITMNAYPNFGKSKIDWEEWWIKVIKTTFRGQLPVSTDYNSLAATLIEEFKTEKCWCLAEGSDRLVNIIRSLGISIGVISNFDPRLKDILQSVNILDNFDFILTSYDSGFSKPDKRIFSMALKYAHQKCDKSIKPSESLHIGDDVTNDYEGARAAGWHALLVTSKKIKSEKPPASEHVFQNLEDVCVAIENNELKLKLDTKP